jgi:tape measure domain-containing protein
VTKSEQEFLKVRKALRGIARATYADLETEADLFKRVSLSVEQYNLSAEARLTVTESIANSMRLMGGTAQEASATMIQLAQAMGSGRLQGDELRSILENNAILARAFAEEMGVGVGELKKVGSEGLITTDRVLKALVNNAEKFREEALKMPPTIEGSMTILRNSFTRVLGLFSDAIGGAKAFGSASKLLAEQMGNLGAAILAVGVAMTVAFVSKNAQTALTFLNTFSKKVLSADKATWKLAGRLLALAAAVFTVIKAWRPINDIIFPLVEYNLRLIGIAFRKAIATIKDFFSALTGDTSGKATKEFYAKWGETAQILTEEMVRLKRELGDLDLLEVIFGGDKLDMSKLVDLGQLEQFKNTIDKVVGSALKDKGKAPKDPIEDYIKSLQKSIAVMGQYNDSQKKLIEFSMDGHKATDIQRQKIKQLDDQLQRSERLKRIHARTEEYQSKRSDIRIANLTEEQTATKKYIDSMKELLKTQKLVGLSQEEMLTAQTRYEKEYLESMKELALNQNGFLNAMYEATESWSQQSAEALVGLGESLISEAHSIKDAWQQLLDFIRNVIRQITVMGTQEFVTKPLFDLVRGGITSAAGAPSSAPDVAAGSAGGGALASAARVKVVNVLDQSEMTSAMASEQGERVIVNAMARNRAVLGIA